MPNLRSEAFKKHDEPAVGSEIPESDKQGGADEKALLPKKPLSKREKMLAAKLAALGEDPEEFLSSDDDLEFNEPNSLKPEQRKA